MICNWILSGGLLGRLQSWAICLSTCLSLSWGFGTLGAMVDGKLEGFTDLNRMLIIVFCSAPSKPTAAITTNVCRSIIEAIWASVEFRKHFWTVCSCSLFTWEIAGISPAPLSAFGGRNLIQMLELIELTDWGAGTWGWHCLHAFAAGDVLVQYYISSYLPVRWTMFVDNANGFVSHWWIFHG